MSIVLFTTLLLFVVLPIFFIITGKKINEKKKPVSFRVTKFILVSYSFVLIVGMILSYVFPSPYSSNYQRIDEEDRAKAQNAVDQFHQAFSSGDFSTIDGVEVSESWQFPYENEESIWLRGSRRNDGDTLIFVKKTKSLSNQIEVIQYSTRYIIDDFDYTYLMKPPTLTFNNNEIFIAKPDPVELDLSKFNKVFTITQFTDESERMFSDKRHIRGDSVLYFRVPDSLVLKEGEGVHISYID